jgi:hypothetical protein
VGVSLFQGAVTNAGTVFASKRGIDVNNVVVFGTTKFGGVTNSGKISASHTGVFAGGQLTSGAAETLQVFSGAIRNNGTISAGVGRGIFLGGIATGSDTLVTLATPAGGITNTGRIVAGNGALGIEVGGFASGGNVNQASVMVGTIAGGVRNAGTISAGDAILVGGQTATRGAVTISLFSGGVGNTGVISATEDGIVVGAKHTASLERNINLFRRHQQWRDDLGGVYGYPHRKRGHLCQWHQEYWEDRGRQLRHRGRRNLDFWRWRHQ